MSVVFTTIRYDVANGGARIILDRPEKKNALSPNLLRELHDALWEADADTRVHAVAISGAGLFGIFAKYALAFSAICSFVRSSMRVARDHLWPKGSSTWP